MMKLARQIEITSRARVHLHACINSIWGLTGHAYYDKIVAIQREREREREKDKWLI